MLLLLGRMFMAKRSKVPYCEEEQKKVGGKMSSSQTMEARLVQELRELLFHRRKDVVI
jgi:hypothetical protein